MDEYVVKQKIQKACLEPEAPEELIEKVVLRAQTVTMGIQAQKQLETAPAEKIGELVSRALIGQLATVSELPTGAQPEKLAWQLEQQPAFQEALLGGNVAARLSSGELMRQLAGNQVRTESQSFEHQMGKSQQEISDIEQSQIEVPVKEAPKVPGIG